MSAKQDGQNQKDKENNKSKLSVIILICIGILILLSLIVLIIILLKKSETTEKVVVESTNRNVIVTPENVDEVANQLAEWEYVPEGYFNTRMSTTWHFSTGDAVSDDAYVKNDKANTNDVYFDVFLEGDESTPILESPVIPIGSELTQIALDIPLDAGEHKCIMVYHLIDDEQNTISTLRIAFKIIVDK